MLIFLVKAIHLIEQTNVNISLKYIVGLQLMFLLTALSMNWTRSMLSPWVTVFGKGTGLRILLIIFSSTIWRSEKFMLQHYPIFCQKHGLLVHLLQLESGRQFLKHLTRNKEKHTHSTASKQCTSWRLSFPPYFCIFICRDRKNWISSA